MTLFNHRVKCFFGTRGRGRTDAGWILSPLPLPLGYTGRIGTKVVDDGYHLLFDWLITLVPVRLYLSHGKHTVKQNPAAGLIMLRHTFEPVLTDRPGYSQL
jgi:hypothetical protein